MATETKQTGELRSSGIGGSDAGVIIGYNKWKTPVELYLEKITGTSDFEGNEATYWGTTLESNVADAYAERTGQKVAKCNMTLRHKEEPWMMAHIDRRIVGKKKGLECKTALGKWWKPEDWGADGTDEVPASYIAQCQHYMAVLEWDEWDLAVLLSGPEFRIYHIERNDSFIKTMVDAEREFWQGVLDKRPPTPQTSEDTFKLFPQNNETTVIGGIEVERAVERLAQLKGEEKLVKAEMETQKVLIQNFMGENSLLLSSDGRELCTWKTQFTRRFDSKRLILAHPEIEMDEFYNSTPSRVLRMKGEK